MAARDGTGKGRILVIDDDEIARQAICDLLLDGGFSVHPLASPIGATQVIATQGIVAAVIDLNMPVMSGDRFIALIRTWDRIRDLPVVLISGEATETVQQAAAQLPGVAVVTKAQMNDQLVATVSYALLRKPIASAPRPSRVDTATAKAEPQLAQSCLTLWRELVLLRVQALPKLLENLAALRAEAQAHSLPNTSQLVTVVLELAVLCGERRAVPADVDSAVGDLLSHLVSVDADKAVAFDRSLAVAVHRSRLDRARLLLR